MKILVKEEEKECAYTKLYWEDEQKIDNIRENFILNGFEFCIPKVCGRQCNVVNE